MNPETLSKDTQYIREQMPVGELLCQLAEEASELSQAALKLRRVFDGTNPTPVTVQEALEDLTEEISDVMLCCRMLDFDPTAWVYLSIGDEKTQRWAARIAVARAKEAAKNG